MEHHDILARAREFIYKHARLLERRVYEAMFEGGSKEAVISALRAYRNPDGGFGNALEPDMRCPYSQPVATETALVTMDEIGYFAPDLLDGIIRYYRDITLPDGGLPFVFKSASEYPHAPWWKAERDDAPSINPTGNVIAILYKQRMRTDIFGEEWFRKNVAYIWRYFENEQPEGYYDGMNWLAFLQHTPDRERAERYRPKVDAWLARPGTIVWDADASGFVQKVLDWAPHPDSYAAKFVTEAEVGEHLRALVREQQEDGGWLINWETVSPAVELEWRGWMTVKRLSTLRAYGVI